MATAVHVDSARNAISSTYDCQSCGKSFWRKDVMLRHRNSCSSSKPDEPDRMASHEQCPRRNRLSCLTCNDLKLECSGGRPCRRCVILEHDCIQVQSSENPERSPNLSRKRTPEQDNVSTIRLDINDGSDDQRRSPSRVIHPLKRNSARYVQKGTGSNETREEDEKQPRHEAEQIQNFERAAKSSRKEGKSDSKNLAKPATKRGRYVSTGACLNCKKRKVRCSGEETCLTCTSAGLVCLYDQGRKRRSSAAVPNSTTAAATTLAPGGTTTARSPASKLGTGEVADSSSESMQTPEILLQILARIKNLEEREERNSQHNTSMSRDKHGTPDSGSNLDGSASSPSDAGTTRTFSMKVFYGSSSLNEPIEVLKRAVGYEGEEQPEGDIESQPMAQSPMNNSDGCGKILPMELRLNDTFALRSAVDTFFSSLNPQYPCINENQFRAQFETFIIARPNDQISNSAPSQFVALVNLIVAEVKALYDASSETHVPGWDEFCKAERTLSHVTWLGGGDTLTIQCLCIKARYLFYIRKPMAAYHCIGQAVRLCFQLGLHNQSSWTNCSPFEIVMRQRIFWSIFYLERHASFELGMPYTIRECEISVDLPKDLDERFLLPDKELPSECQTQSYVPFLSCVIKWARMYAEFWDKFFRINTPKPLSQELAASMDGIILYTMSQFPPHLRWQPNALRSEEDRDIPPFILRQTLALHLRTNQLRLLLRQDSILGFQFNEATARECTTIAASTIDSIYDHCFSQDGQPAIDPIDRYSSTCYVVGAVLTLICIILKADDTHPPPELAISSFNRGISLLEEISPKFHLARYFLDRLARVIKTAQQSVHRYQSPGNPMFDHEELEMDVLMPQMLSFFNDDYWNMDLDKDSLDPQFNIT